MAEDSGQSDPGPDGAPDDVVGKIDEFLNRHRSKAADAGEIPLLTEADAEPPPDDGIPMLTDVVAAPDPVREQLPPRAAAIGSALILRRLVLALDAEHDRLRALAGADVEQVRQLDRLVAELKRVLPGAVRAAFPEKDAVRPKDG
ncbi:MAG TPA: hypothetical protein VFV71_05190 [Burkholderiales bacterium]|nr:hypothetical protein [Burkholderiales bacterium]